MNKLLGDLGKKLIYGFGFGTGMGISFYILKKFEPEEKNVHRKIVLLIKISCPMRIPNTRKAIAEVNDPTKSLIEYWGIIIVVISNVPIIQDKY